MNLTKLQKTRARRLRRNQTDVEKLLWSRLRSGQLSAKFRRQQPIGPYIVDFFCHKHGLVIELDGGQHLENHVRDAWREVYLEACGLRVLRFWNNELIFGLQEILCCIQAELHRPSPLPSPRGRGS